MPAVAKASREARGRERKGAEAAGEGGSGQPITGSYFPGTREEGEEAQQNRRCWMER